MTKIQKVTFLGQRVKDGITGQPRTIPEITDRKNLRWVLNHFTKTVRFFRTADEVEMYDEDPRFKVEEVTPEYMRAWREANRPPKPTRTTQGYIAPPNVVELKEPTNVPEATETAPDATNADGDDGEPDCGLCARTRHESGRCHHHR